MASTYNRKKEERKTQVLVLEHVASQAELIEAEAAEEEARAKQRQEENDRENEEYVKEFEREQMEKAAEKKAADLYAEVMGESCPACHCHHGSNDCPLDDEVRRHNESQEEYLNDDPYWSNPW